MTKTKKMAILIVAILLCGIIIGVVIAKCSDDNNNNEPTKYDVAIRIVCMEVVDDRMVGPVLGVWVFPPDVSEIEIERDYDGKQYQYYVDAYNLPDHPEWSEKWFEPRGEGANVFQGSLSKLDFVEWSDFKQWTKVEYVCERGKYCRNLEACGSSNIWKQRFVQLYITVE